MTERPPRFALAHDYLLVMRGAERTFAEMAALWSDGPIYTLLYDAARTGGVLDGRQVVTSRLQRLHPSQRNFRRLLPLLPLATRDLRPQGVDALISSSSAFAHGVRVPEGVPHVCYSHSPFRYAWHERRMALHEVPWPARPPLAGLLAGVRAWDVAASRRVTQYIANSEITRERIARYYDRDSVVVHPPVEVERFSSAEPEDWFLTVSEVVRHKRIETALEAARRAGCRLRVVGGGPDLERLQRQYASTAEFLGRVDDEQLAGLYARARALVVPNVEEFGIAAVEAQAAGRPVLAADAGGARETVIEGETGHRFPVDDVDSLAAAMSDDGLDRFDPGAIRANAERFSPDAFRRRMTEEVAKAVAG
jgi:glycosyltransferase involved in cell wall biosynthesis